MDYKRNFIKEQRQTLDKEQYPSQRLPQINHGWHFVFFKKICEWLFYAFYWWCINL